MILGNINGEDIASVNVSPGELKKAAQKKFFSQKACKAFVQSMREPDWVLLTLNWRYGRVSDESWQTIKTWDETTW